ncbi:hypothetical protein DFH09DRAFT_972376 [Mycena vulgaris]|nr:hypothetical protein DFH09DRAFT_972376 [Mycena vulgaris]
MTTPTSIVGVTTAGIQDVSGFLPLLGTEQCEVHVSSALERGFFYAAGAPMSIFGSLGIIKAGFTTLWVSLDISPWLRGPRQLRNAGFFPKGVMGKLAYALDTDESIYVAEAQMRSILNRYQTLDVELNLLCWPWLRWNLLMLLFGIAFSSLGLLPYVYIIRLNFSRRPFSESWMYPMLRVYGCVLAATMIQLVVQLRLLLIVHGRLRFHALNSWFQEKGRVPPVSWNADTRSEECLLKLNNDIKDLSSAPKDTNYQYLQGLEKSVIAKHPFSSFNKDPAVDPGTGNASPRVPSILLAICRLLLLGGIAAAVVGYIGCFSLVQASNTSINGPGVWLAAEVVLCIVRLMIWASNPGFDDPPPPIAICKSHGRTGPKVTYDIGWMLDDTSVDDLHAIVVGINELGEKAPSIPPLKSAVKDAKSVVAYLQDDLAVPEHQIMSFFDDAATSGAIEAALEKIATDNSIRPGAPIVIYFACHTAERNDPKAKIDNQPPPPSTPTYIPNRAGFSSRLHAVLEETSWDDADFPRPRRPLVLVTSEYKSHTPGTGLLYTNLLDMLRVISRRKGNNITVILDTCYSGQLGRHEKFDQESSAAAATSDFLIGYPSHVLLAACSDAETAQETPDGGVFTQALLQQLKQGNTNMDGASTSARSKIKQALLNCYRQRPPSDAGRDTEQNTNSLAPTFGKDIRELTYRGLVDEIRSSSEIKKFRQTPVCSGNFQNRLLFNGLLSRKRLGRDTSLNTSVILISSDVDASEQDIE